ncbi:acyl-CoA dehydrogenase [Rhizorhabdus dicambivorans]|uniref:Acyl-CoA dehydrogenase n=1 Tax=Rhizorhabdus dicambivorans TaxID=1850238 RepID=A0A2A4FUI6_9SPHN|nr:acyl-CoA dehydrogenase [Rhizorhabdus dicambivorans]PCE41364.1 acyl-CoA dehydrogenase [Rhizorhabdus dicambivorans]
MDFDLSPELADLRGRVLHFIRDSVVPLEDDPRNHGHVVEESLRDELIELTRAAGFLSPHAPREYGGMGLDHRSNAVVFEAACWSPLGPIALNIQAPDEGNVNLLNKIASPGQKAKWLPQIAGGKIRTAFSMTETATGGAGSDPSLLQTSAHAVDGGYVINGRKYMITGAVGATLNIVMARTFDRSGQHLGATMFLTEIDNPAFRIDRMLPTLDTNSPGGHSEVTFDGMFVPEEDVLGAVGEGFRQAQVRLGPARLTHCMRWLGQAVRCHSIAVTHARQRQSFGKLLLEHQGVGFMLADNEIELQQCRLAIWHAAWLLDRGDRARNETSMTKVLCSELLGRVVDRSLQILGAIGITRDTVVERIYRDIRPFRIYDGPSEIHRHALAQRMLANGPFDPYRPLGR